jgi:hypothetical protein
LENNNTNKLNLLVSFIEKWALIMLILIVYLYVSFRIIYYLAQPIPIEIICGNGFAGALVAHFSISVIVLLVLSFLLFFRKNFSLTEKISIGLIVVILPFISYYYF